MESQGFWPGSLLGTKGREKTHHQTQNFPVPLYIHACLGTFFRPLLYIYAKKMIGGRVSFKKYRKVAKALVVQSTCTSFILTLQCND